jgi:mercuric ion binding protein
MKRFALSLMAIMAAAAASAAERQATIEVAGLTCPSCPYIAASALQSVDSVEIVEGDYDAYAQKAVFLVSYDDAVTTPEAIAGATEQYGYPGRVLDTAPGS